MVIKTKVAFIATESFKQHNDYWYNKMVGRANAVEDAWNTDVKDSSGDYKVVTECHYYKSVRHPDQWADAGDVQVNIQAQVNDKYPNLDCDSALVLHDQGWGQYVGMTNGAHSPSDTRAGGGPITVAIATTATPAAGVETHEVAHSHFGEHDQGRNWGALERTVMTYEGKVSACDGSDSSNRIPINRFGECNINQIRDYMDYQNDNYNRF